MSDDELAAQVEAVLANAIAPGSIAWNSSGVDAPATAAVAAVRIPGRDDVLVAVGDNVDGTPAEADAPFAVGDLTTNLVRTVAFQLIDEGVLDPTLTVDQWVPTLPNADRVTVQMVIDNETGWSDSDGLIEPDPVVTDFGRAWSLREAVELRGHGDDRARRAGHVHRRRPHERGRARTGGRGSRRPTARGAHSRSGRRAGRARRHRSARREQCSRRLSAWRLRLQRSTSGHVGLRRDVVL